MAQRDIQAPSSLGLLGEARVALEVPLLLFGLPRLARAPRGDGTAVVVLPGYGASDASTAVLQAYLRFLGYRPYGWGLGRNTGNVQQLMPRITERVVEVAAAAAAPLHLIGWSLGGYLAREVARDRPDLVRSVITLGSPVVGGPKYTAVADAYRRQGIDLDAVEAAVDARYDTVLSTPVTAIYSKSDGVVAWQACIDERSPNVEHVEVRSSHVGLGFAADVYAIIADRLAP